MKSEEDVKDSLNRIKQIYSDLLSRFTRLAEQCDVVIKKASPSVSPAEFAEAIFELEQVLEDVIKKPEEPIERRALKINANIDGSIPEHQHDHKYAGQKEYLEKKSREVSRPEFKDNPKPKCQHVYRITDHHCIFCGELNENRKD